MQTTLVRIIATLTCRTIAPEMLMGQRVRLHDADALSDDFLSSSMIEPDATAGFMFDLSTSRSSPTCTAPHLGAMAEFFSAPTFTPTRTFLESIRT